MVGPVQSREEDWEGQLLGQPPRSEKEESGLPHQHAVQVRREPAATVCLAEEMEESADGDDNIPTWGECCIGGEPHFGEQLTVVQRKEIESLLDEFPSVFQNQPGRTSKAEHRINSGEAAPVRLPPYRLPHAYRQIVKEELDGMLESGIIEESTSKWSAPIDCDGSLRLCVD